MTYSGTPGPWRILYGHDGTLPIANESGLILARVEMPIMSTPAEWVGNAHKIAAVPDMEAALEAAIQAHDELVQAFVIAGVVEKYDQPEWVSGAKAALAKARGESEAGVGAT